MAYGQEIDSDRLAIVEQYANKEVDLTAYIKEQGFKVVGGLMSCPFHGSDSTPSLRINENKWHCFGCGRGGGLLKFKHECALLDNHHATYYQVAEEFQREYSDLSISIKGTIFKTYEESFEEGWNRMMHVANENYRKPQKVSIKSYDKLIRKAKNKSVDIKVQLLSGIQSGMTFKMLENIVDGTDLTGMDLESLADSLLE